MKEDFIYRQPSRTFLGMSLSTLLPPSVCPKVTIVAEGSTLAAAANRTTSL